MERSLDYIRLICDEQKKDIMLPDKSVIQSCSMRVYKAISCALRCTFMELQAQCKVTSTELCLSIIQLLQEKKIRQERNADGVYYSLSV